MNLNYFTDKERIKIMCENGRKNPHSHDFIEIVYFDCGKGWHNVDGVVYKVTRGDIYIIKRGVSHCYYSEAENTMYSGFSVYNSIFDESFFEELPLENVDDFMGKFLKRYMNATESEDKKFYYARRTSSFSFKDILSKMYAEYKQKAPGYLSVLKSRLIELMIEIMRRSEDNTGLMGKRAKEEICDSIKWYIDNASLVNITVKEIADKIGYSVSHINKVFKAAEGKTIIKYINEVKMRQINKMLLESEMPIEEIMFMYGYSDKKRFYERYKREFGCTPKQYRNRARAESAKSGGNSDNP